jgi:hypothetical protein
MQYQIMQCDRLEAKRSFRAFRPGDPFYGFENYGQVSVSAVSTLPAG